MPHLWAASALAGCGTEAVAASEAALASDQIAEQICAAFPLGDQRSYVGGGGGSAGYGFLLAPPRTALDRGPRWYRVDINTSETVPLRVMIHWDRLFLQVAVAAIATGIAVVALGEAKTTAPFSSDGEC